MSEIAKYYGLIVVFIFSLISGKIFSVFDKIKNRISSHFFSIYFVAFAAANLIWSNIGYNNTYNTALEFNYPHEEKSFFQVKTLNLHPGDEGISNPLSYFLFKKNIGLINIYDIPLNLKSNAVPKYYIFPKYIFLIPSTGLIVFPNTEYKGEVFFNSSRINIARIKTLKPNKIILDLNIKEADRLIINQIFDKNWVSSEGAIYNQGDLLAVSLSKKGNYELTLKYMPILFYFGCILSFLSIIIYFFIFFKRGK